jgi:hypothetical protein
MVDPASMSDWMQASAMLGLVGGVSALFASMFKEDRATKSATARRRPETVSVQSNLRPDRAPVERASA